MVHSHRTKSGQWQGRSRWELVKYKFPSNVLWGLERKLFVWRSFYLFILIFLYSHILHPDCRLCSIPSSQPPLTFPLPHIHCSFISLQKRAGVPVISIEHDITRFDACYQGCGWDVCHEWRMKKKIKRKIRLWVLNPYVLSPIISQKQRWKWHQKLK